MKITAGVVPARSAPFQIETLELAEPNPDEVLVRIVAGGMCHTDLHARAGYFINLPYPIVCGHEGAGIVEAARRADGSVPMRRPDGAPVYSCFFFQQSSFATFVVAPAKDVVKIRRAAPIYMLGPLRVADRQSHTWRRIFRLIPICSNAPWR